MARDRQGRLIMPSVMRFVRAKTVHTINMVLSRLALGNATTTELIKAIGRHHRTGGTYIRHLEATGQIVCVQPAVLSGGRWTAAVWALGDGAAPLPVDDGDEVDSLPRVIVVRKQWEPNHVRMPMDCFLFGVPAAMARAA